MNEFNCSCHINGDIYELLTCAATTTTQAIEQFRDYIESEGGEFELIDGLVIDRVEVDA